MPEFGRAVPRSDGPGHYSRLYYPVFVGGGTRLDCGGHYVMSDVTDDCVICGLDVRHRRGPRASRIGKLSRQLFIHGPGGFGGGPGGRRGAALRARAGGQLCAGSPGRAWPGRAVIHGPCGGTATMIRLIQFASSALARRSVIFGPVVCPPAAAAAATTSTVADWLPRITAGVLTRCRSVTHTGKSFVPICDNR